MSRSGAPSEGQSETLVEYLEQNRWLATGHARTCHARNRTRSAWQNITNKLNSDEEGCFKTWQQWAKYWKDKKSSVKKKVNQMRHSRMQPSDDVLVLNALEERIVGLLGDESTTTDRKMENNLTFPASEGESYLVASESESEQKHNLGLDPLHGPSWKVECVLNGQSEQQFQEEISSSRRQPSYPVNTASILRRRRMVSTRRRLAHKSRLQRQTQMVVIERLIAIEERRVQTEYIMAQTQQSVVDVLRQMSDAWSKQSQALQDLVQKINK